MDGYRIQQVWYDEMADYMQPAAGRLPSAELVLWHRFMAVLDTEQAVSLGQPSRALAYRFRARPTTHLDW